MLGWYVRYYINENYDYITVDWVKTVEEAKAMIKDLKAKNPSREYFYEYAEEDV